MTLTATKSDLVTVTINKESLLAQLRQVLLGNTIIDRSGQVLKEVCRYNETNYEYVRDATETELELLSALDTINKHLRD